MRLILFVMLFFYWMALGLMNFHIAAGLYIFVDIFRPLMFAYSPGAIPASVLAIGTVGFSFIFGLISGKILFKPNFAFWTTIVFLFWVLISAHSSPFPDRAFKGLGTIYTYVIPAILLSTGLNSKRDINYVILIMAISVSIWSARFGINSFSTGVNNSMCIPGSQMSDNNYFASGIVASIPLQLFITFNYAGRLFKFWRKIFLGMLLLSLVALVFSDSRGGALGLVFLIFIYISILSKHKFRDVFILLISAGIIAAALPQSFYDRMSTLNKVGTEEADGSASERLHLIKSSFKAAKDHSNVGVGPYCWLTISQAYSGLKVPMENHNIWIKVWVELGIPGLILFIFIWLGTIIRLVFTYMKAISENDKWTSSCSMSIILSLSSLLVTFTFLNYWDSEYFWLLIGIGSAVTTLHKQGLLNDEEDFDTDFINENIEDVI